MANERQGNRFGVLDYGLLEDISRPSSDKSRTSSKATMNNTTASASKPRLQISSSLELLTPEEVMEQEFDLELVDYGGSSDDTTDDYEADTGRTSEIFHIAEPLNNSNKLYISEDGAMTEDDEDNKQLAIYGSLVGDEETLVDSDEENLIMKEIRAEILNQVRGEMKSELDMYQRKREAFKDAPENSKEDIEDVDEQDPKLREAIIKMRKLDRILSRKVKREKEVKRDRILLQRRLHDELTNVKPEGGSKSKDVQTNTAKFLSLVLPPSHNIGVTENPCREGVVLEDRATPVTPVFATEYREEGVLTNRGKSKEKDDAKSEGHSTTRSKLSRDDATSTSGKTESVHSAGTNSTTLTGKMRGSRKKNFLRRNKELAADAGNVIAMTEDEKCRVDNLLINLDALPEATLENDTVSVNGAAPIEDNPFAVMVADGEGYVPETTDIHRLEHIDTKLKALMPAEEFESIASTPHKLPSSQGVLFTRTAVETDIDHAHIGDLILHETREERNFQTRLREIESELTTLTSAVEHEMESPRLSSKQLQGLLDQCALTMERATTETDALAQSQKAGLNERREALLAAPPKLEENVLQKLLEDARMEMHCSGTIVSTPVYSTDGQTYEGNVESLTEENIRELLQDSRTTSRTMSRSNGSVTEDQTASFFPRKTTSLPTSNTNENHHHHHHQTRPLINGSCGDNIHLTSLDEDDMRAVMASNGIGDDKEIRRSFLPSIDPKGSLTTQKPSLYSLPLVSAKESVWKPMCSIVSDHSIPHDTDTPPTPHRPNSGRPTSGSAGKHRSIVPRS